MSKLAVGFVALLSHTGPIVAQLNPAAQKCESFCTIFRGSKSPLQRICKEPWPEGLTYFR
jgi:hypothetical protein